MFGLLQTVLVCLLWMGKENKDFPASNVSIGLLLDQMMVSTWNFLNTSLSVFHAQ